MILVIAIDTTVITYSPETKHFSSERSEFVVVASNLHSYSFFLKINLLDE